MPEVMILLSDTILYIIASLMLIEAFFIALYLYRIYNQTQSSIKKLDYIATKIIDLRYLR